MDVFEGRYFNWNRKLLTGIGLWPYGAGTRHVIRASFMTVLFLLAMPNLISAIVHYDNVDRLMLNVLAFLTAMVMFLKMVALTIAESNMKELFECISNNWLAIRDEEEQEILIHYSNRGRIITIFYSKMLLTMAFVLFDIHLLFVVTMAICGTSISMMPSVPKILDKINPLEKPRPNMYLLEGEFFVDREKYFIELFFCDVVITLMVTIISVAVDTMYIASTEHCCALNAIISHRLRNLSEKSLENPSKSDDDDSYNKMVHIIKFHQTAVSFTAAINDGFSLNFLFIMTVNLLIIPLDACAILAHLHNPISLCPYATLFVALMIHFFIIFWPGQRVLNHNLSIFEDAYCDEWYILPLPTKKMLLTFMLRCDQPASLSAGGLFLINFETYSMVLRTATSYITVLASFR